MLDGGHSPEAAAAAGSSDAHDAKRQRTDGGHIACGSCCGATPPPNKHLVPPAAAPSAAKVAAGPKPYVCTGFDCIVAREPCAMCAMAMVHSRLRRVVFCLPDPLHGAVSSRYTLQYMRSVNHKYDVYHLPLVASAGPAPM
jgi:tRNA-specific adenosine deaminase 3